MYNRCIIDVHIHTESIEYLFQFRKYVNTKIIL